MWFEHAQFKEKVKFMFNNELSLENVEFENFLFYDIRSFKITFCSKTIPKVVPKKWKESSFNVLTITLNFTNVKEIKCDLKEIGFICNPSIEFIDKDIVVSVNQGENNFKLISEFMFLDEVTPHFDLRYK